MYIMGEREKTLHHTNPEKELCLAQRIRNEHIIKLPLHSISHEYSGFTGAKKAIVLTAGVVETVWIFSRIEVQTCQRDLSYDTSNNNNMHAERQKQDTFVSYANNVFFIQNKEKNKTVDYY